jgi:alpha-amylase
MAKATAVAVQPLEGLPTGSEGLPWWNDTIFYEVFVRSFADSDGDGIGDFNGLSAHLDYLNDGDPQTNTDLGISGLWLMPIHPSPSYHGYDVSDYYSVNPQYGSLEDFRRLLDEAHRRGIRVIIDLVLNHTALQHPWFQAARDPALPYRTWYIWSAEHPGYKGPWGQEVWHRGDGGYYYGIFWEGMPDLNYANPAVVSEVQKIVDFWLTEVGVDGFRLDGAKHIVEEGQAQANTAGTHAWWRTFRTFYKGANPQALAVGEVWDSNDLVAPYLQGDQLDLAFNFDLATAMLRAAADRRARLAADVLAKSLETLGADRIATFLSNHDQNRVLPQMLNDPLKTRLAGAMLLTFPGVPFIYYGEEIDMNGLKPDERIRAPMQWSAQANGGFTTGTPWEPLNPEYIEVNIAAQSGDPDSILSFYRSLIQLRNQHVALRLGQYLPAQVEDRGVLAFLRSSQAETVLVVINVGKDPLSAYPLTLPSGPLAGRVRAVALYGFDPSASPDRLQSPVVNASGGFDGYQPLAQLPGSSVLILQLQAVRK